MYQQNHLKKDKDLRKKIWVAGAVGILPFLYFAIMGLVDGDMITTLDYQLGSFFINLRQLTRTEIAIFITRLADAETQTFVTIAGVLLFFIGRKWRVGLWYGLTVLLGSEILNNLVKNLYQRVRPEEVEHLIEQGGYAFPSGHSMGSVITYGALLFIFIRYVKSTHWQWIMSIFVALLCLMIGLSRVYLGVHYLSDVIGGFSLGFAFLCFSIALFGLNVTQKEFYQRPNKGFHSKNWKL